MSNDEMTTAEAASLLGITTGAVRDAIKRGVLPARKIGQVVYVVRRADVEQYRRDHVSKLGWDKRRQPDYEPSQKALYYRAYRARRKAAQGTAVAEAANMPEPAPESPEPPRLPLWVRWGESTAEYQADGLAIVKPGDEGYDAAYDEGLRFGMHYATPAEVAQWERHRRGVRRRKGRGNG